MPFTAGHPAAILPLLRTSLPASALVVGSMAPDLPYYVSGVAGWPTHTALAVPTVDLVLGGLAWALWHGVLAAPALAAAPRGLRARLAGRVRLGLRHRLGSAGRVGLVAAGLVVGSATHVLWDEFSHEGRWGTEHVAALAARWGPLAGYSWVQHLSTLVGGLVLLWWFGRWWQRTPAVPPGSRPAPVWPWTLLAAVALAAGLAGALIEPGLRRDGFVGATWGGGAAAAVAVVLALGWHARRLARR